ncbi:MAG: helix-turn-helix transcriptional regulator [Candidatus Nanoarchaeia archaeon]
MRNQYFVEHRKAGFLVLASLLVVVSLLAFLTYTNRDITTASPLLLFLIQNHTWLMVILIAVSVSFGYFWSSILYQEIESKTQTNKSIMVVVLRFLGRDEKAILNHLIEHDGKTTQSEISRLHGMNKVKAYRSLQKMQEKQIVDVTSHGKVRNVMLKDDILRTLE